MKTNGFTNNKENLKVLKEDFKRLSKNDNEIIGKFMVDFRILVKDKLDISERKKVYDLFEKALAMQRENHSPRKTTRNPKKVEGVSNLELNDQGEIKQFQKGKCILCEENIEHDYH
jgi:hypothetical protein